ncbi:MAG: hypothetical protein MUP85_22590 [Candidatus Lokiarchaeota archaeon]|nr:hypothetical protein [Candidatus Lokiarchaeota archaeon]
MSSENIIVYLNVFISSAVLIFIIWDHFKDDRLLAKEVQEFYGDIENLIYTQIQIEYYKIIEKKQIEDTHVKLVNKTRNKDIIQNSYLKTKVSQNFEKYSNYLGLTIDREDLAYLNSTIYLMTYNGLLKKRDFERNNVNQVISSFTNINNEEISDIDKYLTSLRFYWNKKYYRFLFRPKLVQKISFSSLLGSSAPLEKKKGIFRIKLKK